MRQDTPSEKRQDKEANLFARCLLMPRLMVEVELNKLRGNNLTLEQVVPKMAKTFQVSNEQMTIRLFELKLIIY